MLSTTVMMVVMMSKLMMVLLYLVVMMMVMVMVLMMLMMLMMMLMMLMMMIVVVLMMLVMMVMVIKLLSGWQWEAIILANNKSLRGDKQPLRPNRIQRGNFHPPSDIPDSGPAPSFSRQRMSWFDLIWCNRQWPVSYSNRAKKTASPNRYGSWEVPFRPTARTHTHTKPHKPTTG